MSSIREKGFIMDDLRISVETWDIKLAQRVAREAVDSGIPLKEIVAEGLGAGMARIGEMFGEGNLFLPQVIAASKTMEAALEVLRPYMEAGCDAMRGTVVMGTVKGDIHEIGKNVCCAMLRGAGYLVVDLGSDTGEDEFIDAAAAERAQIVGCSALMTTTLKAQESVVRYSDEAGRGFLIIIGGAPCSQEWCDQIHADGYSSSGAEIVDLVNGLMEKFDPPGRGTK